MEKYVELTREYRGKVLDLVHMGNLCVVDEHGNVLHALGDPENITCYRSSSKPIQALPVIARDLDKKYGFTEQEAVIFSASHIAEERHLQALESMAKKAGLKEEDMIMLPTWPQDEEHKMKLIREGKDKRKYFHNCSGKHTALMLLQRELGGPVNEYWKISSPCQKEVKKAICAMSETNDAQISLDGCGVPVFSVPLKNIAIAYKNLACIDTIKDESLQKAAKRYIPTIHNHPLMIRGTDFICSIMNMDPNIIAKGGSNGVYGFGLKKQRIGVSLKLADGTETSWPIIILQVLKDLDALTPEHEERILALKPFNIYNDNNSLAGKREASFSLRY
ncbi:MAG: asparaginase [Eubacteriales bacterium]|nr:asparaginase [Eubacteriales bacterium]